MKLINILSEIVNKELENYFNNNPYSLEEEMNILNEIIIGELLNPENSLPYSEKIKGMWVYDDPNGVQFFVRAHYIPEPLNFLEFKTGWFDENGKITYEPSVPYGNEKTSLKDINSRSDTVAKIYRDEIIPFFEKQNLTNTMMIKPISLNRSKFAERLVKKFTPIDKFNIEIDGTIIITKK
jgi:hypothetical protein